MIGPLGFAVKNLRRRGFHALLAFLGLTLTVGSTTFLLLLGVSIASRFGAGSSARMTFGITWLLLGYLLVSLGAIVLVGVLSASYLVSSMVNQRMKDIAVVKAAGCLPRRLLSYSMAEASLVVWSSCVSGAVAAVLFYRFLSISSLPQFSSVGLTSGSAALVIVAVPGASFFLSYLSAYSQLRRIIRTATVSAISSQLSSLNLKSLGKPLRVKRFGSSFGLASRTASRDRAFTRTLVRVSICMFLTTVVLTGALVAGDTSKSYVQRAVPPQVLVLGTSSMVSQYLQLQRAFSSSNPVPPLDYLNSSNMVSPNVAAAIRGIPGIIRVDGRLMTVSSVTGYSGAQLFGGQITGEEVTGSGQALIVGIDPNYTIGDWYTSDGFLTGRDPENSVVIGDSLVGNVVSQPLNSSEIRTLGVRFDIKGALVDPLNAGWVVYASNRLLQQVLGTNGYNLLLVKVSDYESTLTQVSQIAVQNGLVVARQDLVLQSDLALLDSEWSSMLILPIITLALTAGILVSYLTTNYSKRFNDYVVLKVLGAKTGYTLKLLLWEAWGLLAVCMVFAVPPAFLFTTIFFVPGATINPGELVPAGIAVALALSAPCIVGSAIYSRRIDRMTVKDLKP